MSSNENRRYEEGEAMLYLECASGISGDMFAAAMLDLGADISSESLTKYMNGHGDALGGSISTNSHEIYYELQRMMGVVGCCLSPFNSFLVMRGLQTLAVRMESHCDHAERIVEYLRNHDHVLDLTYPGMEEHPQHETAKKELKLLTV